MLPAAGGYLDIFDDEQTLLGGVEHPAYGAIRTPDGRALAWSEYGSARGVPVLLIPDAGSSRLAPVWLLHDSALPSSVRLLALDRPGTGASDPVGLGGRHNPADDLRRMVETLAVGRVAVVGIGRGIDEAFAFAAAHPRLVAMVAAVSPRPPAATPVRRRLLRAARPHTDTGLAGHWATAAGKGADLRLEPSWSRALTRMDPSAAIALQDRWREADFRAAVADDLGQGGHEWAGVTAIDESEWSSRARDLVRPVQVWYGRDEYTATVSDIKAIAAGRPDWTVSGVAGPSATLGCWPQILAAAAASVTAAFAA